MDTPDLTNATWRKSSFSGNNGECVEVAALADGRVAVRDSNNPHTCVVLLTRPEMAAFIKGVKACEYDDLG